MLRIMLVDDESLFREALRKTIPWESLGYEICCEAENGIDALEKIHQYKPHVALVDINMPMLDGIELAAEIKENGLNVTVIIITGYEEFAYARQAIEVGVENYLLKPVQEEQLIKVLASVKKKHEIAMEEWKQQVKVHKPLLKEMLLNNLLQGTKVLAAEQWNQLKPSLAIDPDAEAYRVLAVEIADPKEAGWNDEEKRLWAFAAANIARDVLAAECTFDSCQDADRLCAVVAAADARAGWPLDLARLGENIRQSLLKYAKLDVAVGVSRMRVGVGRLPESYREALYALNRLRISGRNGVLVYSDAPVSDEAALRIFPVEQRQQLLMGARMNDSQWVGDLIRSIFGEIRQAHAPVELVVNKCVELVSTCLEFVDGTGNEMKGVFGEDSRLLGNLYERRSIDEWEQRVLRIYSRAMAAVAMQENQSASKTVEKAKDYIDRNLGKYDLKIDEIARHAYIGYGRLCELFKRETGVTINNYMTDARIRQAKRLIDEGCRSVSAVSAQVGYADANYFGKCFKKKYGIAPGNYIDKLLAK
ncbi:response regulator [Cohnella zeiphila]|uniref:Response regulator n=1 Tax=Cohnella zeiphila TaxID=2761120 RepID=A0A7X0VVY3_9BACL|nr:response regulator [Cohnella zeiphila]MBB6731857.1 response regulator [Cohnella zeiphila]